MCTERPHSGDIRRATKPLSLEQTIVLLLVVQLELARGLSGSPGGVKYTSRFSAAQRRSVAREPAKFLPQPLRIRKIRKLDFHTSSLKHRPAASFLRCREVRFTRS